MDTSMKGMVNRFHGAMKGVNRFRWDLKIPDDPSDYPKRSCQPMRRSRIQKEEPGVRIF